MGVFVDEHLRVVISAELYAREIPGAECFRQRLRDQPDYINCQVGQQLVLREHIRPMKYGLTNPNMVIRPAWTHIGSEKHAGHVE